MAPTFIFLFGFLPLRKLLRLLPCDRPLQISPHLCKPDLIYGCDNNFRVEVGLVSPALYCNGALFAAVAFADLGKLAGHVITYDVTVT